MKITPLYFILIGLMLYTCASPENTSNTNTDNEPKDFSLFTRIEASQSKLNFRNPIYESDRFNYFTYEYLYNGGGVAIGDINNDGLPDIYLTANFEPNRLFLNKGNLVFEDITAKAQASTVKDWATGVTMVDINNDGWLDIYVCRSGVFTGENGRSNLLFINNKDLTFTEKALDFGLGDTGYSTQATFFDYDRDGDLDVYVANHPHIFSEDMTAFLRKTKNPPLANRDRLYRNDLVISEQGVEGTFTDVSDQAGIINYGHTLGIIASDLNDDGWIDIYASNDYSESDLFYKNNGDGTFSNIILEAMGHMAKFSMGVDAQDFNNDGLTDIFAAEMQAEDNKRQKTNMAPMNPKVFWATVDQGFGYQYMHNVLQLNRDKQTFSEIAYLSGVATTDWSWAPLFADFDNDGWKDLFVTNGYRRDILDKDFKKKLFKYINDTKDSTLNFSQFQNLIPSTQLSNYIFKNNRDLTFTKKNKDWGLHHKINSNGAAYADLDLDGDLDLVINNIDDEAYLYRNNTIERSNPPHHFLRFKCQGLATNTMGLGTKVKIWSTSGLQTQELSLSRGFQSSVEPIIHFGLGTENQIDSVEITWPDGKKQVLKNLEVDQVITLNYQEARTPSPESLTKQPLFTDISQSVQLNHKHQETLYDDYSQQVLLPHKLSQLGPSIVVSDVNGDGLDDFFVGGAAGFAAELFMQSPSKTFQAKNVAAFQQDKAYEDMGALFFDCDQDGDQDLLVTSGSYEFEEQSPLLQDRLYINDGQGNFTRQNDALPKMLTSSACAVAGDYDQDGDLDLFIGSRLVAAKYPQSPVSYLLENNQGKFKVITQEAAPELSKIGMVSSALWTDYDNDEDLDLMVVGEWMPISVFENNQGKLALKSPALGLEKSSGWWNSITGGDFDNDGDIDYVLGNLGTNSKNKASTEYPFHIYAGDYDESGTMDIILSYYNDGIQFPVRGKQCSTDQIPALEAKIPTYEQFGSLELEGIYSKDWLNKSLHLEAQIFTSIYLQNNGSQGFSIHHLPVLAQIAPNYGLLAEDFNLDGNLDILLVGNQYPVEVETGRYDAHKGLLLLGGGDGTFEPLSPLESGLAIQGDAKSLSMIALGEDLQPAVLLSQNNGATKIFTWTDKKGLYTRPESNTSALTRSKRKIEFYWGCGYLSQHSHIFSALPAN